MEQLSGLDASFLYLETPTLHMHVEMVDRLRPVHRARRLLVRQDAGPDRLAHPPGPGLPAAAWSRSRSGSATRCGSTTPTSTSTTTSAGAAVPARAACASWPTWPATSPAASSTGPSRCGRSGSSRAWPTGGSPSSPRCTTRPSTACRGPRCSRCCSTSRPTPVPTPSRRPRPAPARIPSSAELISEAMAARIFRPFELTRDVLRTGQRLLNVRRVRNEPEHRAPQAKAALPLSAPRTSFNGDPHPPAPGGARRHRPGRRQAAEERHRHHRQRRRPGRVHRRAAAVPARRRRAARQAAGRRGPRVGAAGPGRAVRVEQGVGACSCSCPAHLDDPMERLVAIREGTKGAKEEHNALGADMLVNWAEHATPNTFAAAARLYSRMRLADRHRPDRQPDHLERARSRLPALPGRRRDGRRVPARSGHGRHRGQHHHHELPGRPLLGDHLLPRDHAARCGSWPPTSRGALDELLAAAGEAPAEYRSDEAAEPRPPACGHRRPDATPAADPPGRVAASAGGPDLRRRRPPSTTPRRTPGSARPNVPVAGA